MPKTKSISWPLSAFIPSNINLPAGKRPTHLYFMSNSRWPKKEVWLKYQFNFASLSSPNISTLKQNIPREWVQQNYNTHLRHSVANSGNITLFVTENKGNVPWSWEALWLHCRLPGNGFPYSYQQTALWKVKIRKQTPKIDLKGASSNTKESITMP